MDELLEGIAAEMEKIIATLTNSKIFSIEKKEALLN